MTVTTRVKSIPKDLKDFSRRKMNGTKKRNPLKQRRTTNPKQPRKVSGKALCRGNYVFVNLY